MAAQQWEVAAAQGEPGAGEGEVGLAWRALRHLQKNTHSYNAVADTVKFVLPVGSGAASSALAAVKKQEGAPSREIGYTTTPPPPFHPPPFPVALW